MLRGRSSVSMDIASSFGQATVLSHSAGLHAHDFTILWLLPEFTSDQRRLFAKLGCLDVMAQPFMGFRLALHGRGQIRVFQQALIESLDRLFVLALGQ